MKLNYIKMGEGQALIILHGLFGSLDNWMSLGKKFAENCEVWLVDQRNHGHSPHSDQMNYSLMATDLQDFIMEHHISQPVVLGHSMGGKTAMEYCMKYNEISKLIVADMSPLGHQHRFHAIIKGLNAVDPQSLSSRKEAESRLEEYVKEVGVKQFLLKNLHRSAENSYEWRFNLPVLQREIEQITQWEIEGAAFEKEALFLKGGDSDYINKKSISRIQELFPKSKIEEIEGAGHWLHAEKPEEFYKLVKNFIKA